MTEQHNEPDREDLNWKQVYILRLFITGASPNSSRAIANLKDICEEHLKGNYELEIIDVYQQPLVAQSEQVIALPMLVKMSPSPVRKLIGNMAEKDKVLKGLGLIAAS